MIKAIISITKNNAVPTYAKKLVSGSGKKNKVSKPTNTIAGIIYCSFINQSWQDGYIKVVIRGEERFRTRRFYKDRI